MNGEIRNTLNPDNWNTQFREYLIRFALQRTNDYGTAEDLVQETFVSAWNARERFRGECNEKTWLTGILRNKIIDHYRKTDRRPSVLTTDLDGSQPEGMENISWIDRQPDERSQDRPTSVAQRYEFMQELETAVSRLPGTMGEAFRMREIQGYSTEEITKALNISRSNLWVLIHRAKQNLSEQLQSTYSDAMDAGGLLAA